jgi:flagellar assembly factor FliW
MSTLVPASHPGLSRQDIHFAAGIPGFPRAKSFKVSAWGADGGPFLVLECTDIAGLRFVAAAPAVFFSSYEPSFGPEVYRALTASGPEDIVVLAIVTLRPRPEETTFNLLGPLVVNGATGEAVQAVLSGSGYDPQTPIGTPS